MIILALIMRWNACLDPTAEQCEAENKMRKVGWTYLPLIPNFNNLNAIFREWGALKLLCKALSANPGNPSEILNSDFNVVPDFVFFFFF